MPAPPKMDALVHLHLQVSDMKRSIDFYTTVVGFFYDHGTREMAWLTRPRLLLTLSPGEPSPQSTQYQGILLAEEAALDEWYGYLRQRGVRLSSPPDPAGERPYFFAYDPDDYALAFSLIELDYPERFLPGEAQR